MDMMQSQQIVKDLNIYVRSNKYGHFINQGVLEGLCVQWDRFHKNAILSESFSWATMENSDWIPDMSPAPRSPLESFIISPRLIIKED